VDFRILGPLEVASEDRLVPIEIGRQQRIMASLAARANRVVTTSELIDLVWPEAPPSTVRSQVANCVGALRRTLVAAGLPADHLARVPAGHVLRADGADLDWRRFEELVARARRALGIGRREEAAALFRRAEAEWRGPALVGLDEGPLEAEAIRLEELRLQALEDRIEVELELGRHRSLVPDLIAATRTHPWRDRLQRSLMIALYRSGQAIDALSAFDRLLRLTRIELGLEPSQQLRALRQAILVEDPGLALDPR
jgi:DNA-binding SARP family transcriptional activator